MLPVGYTTPMRVMSNRSLFILAVIMLALGALLPILIVSGVLKSTFLLNFFTFGLSVSGLFLGYLTAGAFFTKRDDDLK